MQLFQHPQLFHQETLWLSLQINSACGCATHCYIHTIWAKLPSGNTVPATYGIIITLTKSKYSWNSFKKFFYWTQYIQNMIISTRNQWKVIIQISHFFFPCSLLNTADFNLQYINVLGATCQTPHVPSGFHIGRCRSICSTLLFVYSIV